MAETCGDGVASSTFNVHEVGVWSLNESLELVLVLFRLISGVEEIDIHLEMSEIRVCRKIELLAFR